MEKNKHKLIFRTVIAVFISIFLILFLANVSIAVMDCPTCHKTEPGKSSLKAKDTIEINEQTCLKCHDPEYPPTPIGYNTHLTHVGKYSAKVDYFNRHPKIAKSLNCDNCHMNIGENCQNCHVKNIPHIQPPLGNNCKGCHNELDQLFRHPTINLKIHDLFNLGNTTACTMCHNPDNMASLKLASGDIVSIQEPHKLCIQCHSNYYNLWDSGQHHSNKSIPSEEDLKATNDIDVNIPELKATLEDKWRKENTCTNCHNPHNPSELYQLPFTGENTSVSFITLIESNPLYAVLIAIVVLIPIVAMVVFKNKNLKLNKPKLQFKKLPKFKLPKFSIPISITVEPENPEKVSTVNKNEYFDNEKEKKEQKIEIEKKDEKFTDRTVPRTEKKKFLQRRDIVFVLGIGIMLGLFYIVFGAFIPIAALVSESMSPHMEKGDIVFYTDISKIDEIITYDKNAGYRSFEDYGNVIIYKPFGKEGVTPYIHRAMYYVEIGEEMWPGGPKAPHAGYITKGDNTLTNPQYDQQIDLSYLQPVKKEWIIGVARFRIPYIGYIRMILP